MEDTCFYPLGEAERVNGSHDRGLGGFDRVVLVVWWRRWAGEVVDLIDFEFERVDHIVTNQFKVRICQQVTDITLKASEEVVETEYLMAFVKKTFGKMGAKETGSSCD